MVKKIILGVLFLGLVGALVIGAVNRTAAKSAEVNGAQQHGAGWARMQEAGAVLAANVQGRGGQGGGRNSVEHTGAAGTADAKAYGWQGGGGHNGAAEQAQGAKGNQSGQGSQDGQGYQGGQGGQGYQGGQGGRGNGVDTGDRQGAGPIAETEDHQWMTITGTVISIDETQMVVQTASGEIVIADRPWSFALAAGFTAQVGDQVTLDGFYENDTFETGRLTNGELVVSIREDSGRPLWAGNGRGRGRTW